MSNYVLSQAAYSKVYEDFQEWRRENSVNGVDENILLAFFEDLSHKYSPNTLWPKLSMLRSMLHLREKTDVKLFDEVEAFVKNKNKGYIPKKSEVLSRQQLKKFLREAPNDIFLMYKVVLIMEIFGACRTNELVNINQLKNKKNL
ncbi:hypothetical protein Zmor_002365 [Zophobas morio]|uniref:Uncharacterized protein n=1 Tax=Zophobas morio TaxID=2755281 RepID=A0AA38J0W0_9CUCU|nr:hypothetical protein Zmor_002365 [Zophobas morio]